MARIVCHLPGRGEGGLGRASLAVDGCRSVSLQARTGDGGGGGGDGSEASVACGRDGGGSPVIGDGPV